MSQSIVAFNDKTGESVYFIETGYASDLRSYSAPAITIGTNYYRLKDKFTEGFFEEAIEGATFYDKVRAYSAMDEAGRSAADRIISGNMKDRVLELLGDSYRIGVEEGDAKNFVDIVTVNIDSTVECGMNSLRNKIEANLRKVSHPSRELAKS